MNLQDFESAPAAIPEHQGEFGPDAGRFPELLRLSLPLVVTFVSHVAMGMVDTLVMGKVGTAEQGGVGMGAAFFWSISSFASGLLSAVTTFVAQAHGARDHEDVRTSVETGMWLVWPLSALTMGVVPLLPALLAGLRVHEAIAPHTQAYLTWMLLASPVFLMNFTIIGFFRGIADTLTPMLVTLGVNVVNIVLDFSLVLGWWGLPRMGVHGVALATVISMALSAGLLLLLYASQKHHALFGTRRFPRTSLAQVRRFLRVGVPIGISWLLENMAFTVMSVYIGRFEPALSAANTIVFQLCHVSFMPAVAISIAACALVGRYIGAARPDLARASAHRTLGLSVAYMGLLGVAFLLFPHQLLSGFSSDDAVIRNAALPLRMAAFFQVFDALGVATDGIFRGAGITLMPMVVRLAVMWGVFVPGIFLFHGFVFTSPLHAGWAAGTLAIMLMGSVLLGIYALHPWWRRTRV